MLVITFAKHNSTERIQQYLMILLFLRTNLIFCNDVKEILRWSQFPSSLNVVF